MQLPFIHIRVRIAFVITVAFLLLGLSLMDHLWGDDASAGKGSPQAIQWDEGDGMPGLRGTPEKRRRWASMGSSARDMKLAAIRASPS